MQCSRHGIVSVVGRERGAEMIDAGNDSCVVGRERGGREEAKMIDPVGRAANCSVHEGRGHKKAVCAPLQRQCSRRTTESRPRYATPETTLV